MSDIEVDNINVFGPGLVEGKTGKRCLIYFSGLPINSDDSSADLYKDITHTIEGPKNPEIIFDFDRLNEDNNVEAYYVPLLPGDYKINIYFKKQLLNGCPFTAQIIGKPVSAEKLIRKVQVFGKASSLGRALIVNEFLVDCSKVKPVLGGLTVHVKGPVRSSAHLDIIDNRNGTYQILYKPILPGTYNMDIKIADTHIPGSPFKIRVLDRSNSIF
ncbi:filamin-C-like [Oppia nitens]|uniref:filamin-C-like n=1 Tax=Oppia nitens TaxID=1686743 RepID=UPI0023DC32BE|nr:filamin-C-like [Oppia nitens]